jgi:hypothetical protein
MVSLSNKKAGSFRQYANLAISAHIAASLYAGMSQKNSPLRAGKNRSILLGLYSIGIGPPKVSKLCRLNGNADYSALDGHP